MASLLLNGRETTCFLLHENKARMSALTAFVRIEPKVPISATKARDGTKRHADESGRVGTVSICRDVTVKKKKKKPRKLQKELLEAISEFIRS